MGSMTTDEAGGIIGEAIRREKEAPDDYEPLTYEKLRDMFDAMDRAPYRKTIPVEQWAR